MSRLGLFACVLFAVVSGISCGPEPQKAPAISVADPVIGAAPKTPTFPEEKVVFTLNTTKGKVVIHLYPEWSPMGVKRIQELTQFGFYDDAAFFRIVPGFVAQFGMNGNPEVHQKWSDNNIDDEPVKESNRRGYVTFAKTNAPNTRSTQLFINFKDNANLDQMGFSPIGRVIEGMDIVEQLNAEYGEQPDQSRIQERGNVYLRKSFPRLDYITTATIGEQPDATK